MNRLMWLGFFFLLRPGEYLSKAGAQFPFKLKQVFFRVSDAEYRGDVIPIELLDSPSLTFGGLIFDKQKNGVPDEKIGLGTSAQIGENPVNILAGIVRHLRTNAQTTGETPLFIYYDQYNIARKVTDRLMTSYLQKTGLSLQLDTPPTIGAL